jgi:hypothetical protein
VEAVKSHEKPLLRPSISEDACEEEVIRMMKSCWADEPLERPDFQQLKGIIRKLNKCVSFSTHQPPVPTPSFACYIQKLLLYARLTHFTPD